ncbi:hypothetical protein [Flavobacterium sp. XGLA_31]|uniref:hypothetical protein n=1 Tax=Flavobacterium sp. XGLA_31 TaxID=3447666 RepID=UPI003F40694F
MDKFEFIKEWFYKEEERKDSLNNSLNIPIGILTAILAGIYFLTSKYNYKNENIYLKYSFIVAIIVALVFWLFCIYYLVKSYNDFYKGYKYNGFPSANFIDVEYENMKSYYDKYKKELGKEVTLDSLVKNNVENILIKCVENNTFNNDKKSAYLHNSKIQILNCVLALFLSSILYSVNYINHEKEEIQKVYITNKNIMSDEHKIQQPPPPPKPQEPRVIKESEQPTRQAPPPQKPTPSKQ